MDCGRIKKMQNRYTGAEYFTLKIRATASMLISAKQRASA